LKYPKGLEKDWITLDLVSSGRTMDARKSIGSQDGISFAGLKIKAGWELRY
jgi:hypothetical protein